MGRNKRRGWEAVRAGGCLPLGVLVCGGVALNALVLPAAAIDFRGNDSAGDAVIDNIIEGVNFYDQSTAGNATINNSFSGVTTFNDQSTAGNAVIRSENGGWTVFRGQSTAGNAVIHSENGGATILKDQSNAVIHSEHGGETVFSGQSTAGSAVIRSENGGRTVFRGQSTAGNAVIHSENGGETVFSGQSTAGNAVIHSENGGETVFSAQSTAGNAVIHSNYGGETIFSDQSTAGNAVIRSDYYGGTTIFSAQSTAGNATIINNSFSGVIFFNDQSTAGNGVIRSENGGRTVFSGQSTAGNATINNSFSGVTFFNDQSTAGNAVIRSENGGETIFSDQSTAGNALITSGEEGSTSFTGNSDGGTARLVTESGGVVDFSGAEGPGGEGRFTVGSIEGNGVFALGSAVVAIGSNNLDTQVTGTLIGDAGSTLVKIGTGTLTVRGENADSFGSTIRIEGGLINFDVGSSLGSGEIVLDGGGLQWGDSSSFDISEQIEVLGAAGGTFDTNGNDVSLADNIGGSGSLRKTGEGVLELLARARYRGATIVEAGTLRQGSNGSFVQGGAYVINGGALDLNSVGLIMSSLSGSGGQVLLGSADLVVVQGLDTRYSGNISGTGGLTKLGAGMLLLEGRNDYSGITQVSGGTLRQGAAGAFISGGSYTVNGGVLDLNGFDLSMGSLSGSGGELALGAADLTLVQGGDSTFSGVISGSGGLIKQGNGTLTLSGNNNYSGTTRVEAGALRQDSAGGLVSGGAYDLSGGVLDLGGSDLGMSSLAGDGGQLVLNGATLTVDQAGNTRFAGAMLGSGAFIKDGAGTLDLTGSHSFSGTTEVRGGTLAVNGALPSVIQVQGGATLGGIGNVGNVRVASGGILAPGNSIGTLNVDDDLILSPGSIYQVETDAAGNADRVVVDGLASLAGSVQVLAENGSYTPSTNYTILSAGQLSGQFDGVSSNLAFLDPRLSYEDDAVILTLARNDISFSGPASTPNQQEFAEGAQSLDQGNEVYRTLVDQGEDEVADTFNKLSGDAHASIASSVMFDDLNLSRAPLGNLRRNLASPERALPYWAQVSGGRQILDDDGNAGRVIVDQESMLLGGDWPVYDDWRLGGAFGYGQERLGVGSRGAKADSDSYRYTLYGGRDITLPQGTLKIFGGGGYSQHQIDSRRDVRLIDGPERLTRQYDVTTTQGFGELAWHLKLGEPAYLEPFVGLLLIDQRSDSFREKGGAAALSASSQRNELLSTSLGVRGQQLFQVAQRDLLLNGSLTWRQINGDLRPELELQLEGGDKFRVLGTQLPRNSFLVELKADYSITSNIVLDVNYSGVFSGRSNANNIAFNLHWKM